MQHSFIKNFCSVIIFFIRWLLTRATTYVATQLSRDDPAPCAMNQNCAIVVPLRKRMDGCREGLTTDQKEDVAS